MVALPSTTFNPFSSALNHVSLLTSSPENKTKKALALYPLQAGRTGAGGACSMSQGLTRALLELRAAEVSLLMAHRGQQHQPSPWLVNKVISTYSASGMMTNQHARTPPAASHLSHQQTLLQALHFKQCATHVAPATPSSASSTPTIEEDGPLDKSTREANTSTRGDLKDVDILCGRGGKSNHHIGNKRFRKLVSDMKARYKNIDTKMAKTELSRAIVEHVHRQGGRFVRFDKESSTYVSMSLDDARKKTSQALRESKDVKWTV